MGQEPRKATDILLELENRVNVLLDIVRAQDLNIKVLSNKLNEVMGHLKKQNEGAKIRVEAVQTVPLPPAPIMPPTFTQLPAGDPERNIPIVADRNLPQTQSPEGFRRTSRPESFAGDNQYLNRPPTGPQFPQQLPQQFQQQSQQQFQQSQQQFQQPQQQFQQPRQSQNAPPPGRSVSDAPLTTPMVMSKKGAVAAMQSPAPEEQMQQGPVPEGQIPVMQRIVDKNGKSVFLADVEITDLSTSQPVFKTRTNGTGKWMASLGIGAYQVKLVKRANVGKEKLEAVQDIQVDGSQSPLNLPMLILK